MSDGADCRVSHFLGLSLLGGLSLRAMAVHGVLIVDAQRCDEVESTTTIAKIRIICMSAPNAH